jgi:positive regulator of sigma E activity
VARVAGTVVEIRDGHALVECRESSGACDACGKGRGCSWRRRLGTRSLAVPVPAAAGDLEAGDPVELEIPDGRLLVAVASLYGPPLVGLLGGPLLLRALDADAGAASLVAAVTGLLAGLLAARRLTQRGAIVGLVRA